MNKFIFYTKNIESVNQSESTINFTDAVKVILFWILSKFALPYRNESVKEVSETFEILILMTLRSW